MAIDGLTYYATENAVARNGQVVKLRRLESLAFGLVYCRQPAYVRRDQIHEVLYGEQVRDRNIISVHICKLNKRLAAIGVRIVGHPGRGYLLEAR
jgi:DNA-binding response OmpR family regulator